MQTLFAVLLASFLLVACNDSGPAGWSQTSTGFRQPADASIPTSSLSPGTFPANNWTGITSPATTVFTGGDGFKYIRPTADDGSIMATGLAWRDQEVTTWLSAGEIRLRVDTSNNGLFYSLGNACPGCLRIGILQNNNEFNTYVQDTPSVCITGWPSDGSHTITYGVRGFSVYLKIDGVIAIDTCQTTTINPTGAISYYEYRPSAMQVGSPQVIPRNGNGARDVTLTYFTQTPLFSTPPVFDPRDFGLRALAPLTGSIAASSTTLNLNSTVDIRVGDRIIVEIGGESGAGARNTVGVGGTSPVLHYADATTRNADHSQADGTISYIDTDGSTTQYSTGSSTWVAIANVGYYNNTKNPISLIASVSAINASPASQITLTTAASVTATNANIYLDSLPSFYPFTTLPSQVFVNRDDGLTTYPNMSLSIPVGTWYFSDSAAAYDHGSGSDRASFTLYGQGVSLTTVVNPKGVPSRFFDAGTGNNSVSVRDFSYVGNFADNGFMFAYTGTNKQWPGDGPVAMLGGQSASNATFQNLACTNDYRGCISLSGTNPQILNSSATMTVGQREYQQWQLQLSNCTGGQIANSTTIGAFLLKSFEMFACNGASINNTTTTNGLYSTNSSTSWTISSPNITIQTNSWFSAGSGAIDEAIINVNDNAFGGGSFGTISNPRIIQQGYIDVSNNSLKFIQIDSNQTHVTVQGGFPGGGGCTTSLGGYMSAPNYDAGSAEFGAMAVYSNATNTTIIGIRIVGTAKAGAPGTNIYLAGASSSATNNVADAIAPGPTISGNQTNAAYGGC